MKKCLLLSMALLISSASQFKADAIEINDDEVISIYCVSSLESKRGVYTLPISGEYSATKISGTTYIQYDFSGSGGTFTDRNTVYGSKQNGFSIFAGKATSEGNGDGPWSHTLWSWRTPPPYVNFTYEIIATDMTFDPETEQIYGWFKADDDGNEHRLCIYDGEKCSITPVGPNSSVPISAIAADKNGQLWGVSGALGAIYAIDKTNGTLQEAGSIPVSANGKNQSATFEFSSGKLYWNAVEDDTKASLYRIDVNTCSAERIYDFPAGERFSAFFIPDKEPAKTAPAKVEDLAGRFTGKGSDVEVTFTLPDKTYGGSSLKGNVKYSLTADGSEIDAGAAEAGSLYAKTFSLAAGNHTLTVTMSNGSGNGPVASANVFVGFDEPDAVTNIKTSVNGNEVTLTWDEPKGINGGVIDLSQITYSVTRIPEWDEVATGLTETTFTDKIPEAPISEYTYTVTVYNGSEAGLTGVSEPVLVGKANTVPYRQDFDSVSDLGDIAYKVINDRPSSNTWILDNDGNGNKFMSVTGQYPNNRDDYFFTAPISFSKGITYNLKFKIANNSATENTQIRILLSRAQSRSEEFHLRPYIEPNLVFRSGTDHVGEFEEQSMTFSVEESGEYCLGFYDFGSYYTSNTVYIDDIEITAEEMPGPAIDMAVTEVKAPETVSATGYFEVIATITNNGTEPATCNIILESDSKTISSAAIEKPIQPGAQFQQFFELKWTEDAPDNITYIIRVETEGDEDNSNDVSEPFTVAYDKRSSLKPADTAAANALKVKTSRSQAEITGAEGLQISVIAAASGTEVARVSQAPAKWTVTLAPGLYLVKAGTSSAMKVMIR